MTEVATATAAPLSDPRFEAEEKTSIDTLAAAHDPALERTTKDPDAVANGQGDAQGELAVREKLEELETRPRIVGDNENEKGEDQGAAENAEKHESENGEEDADGPATTVADSTPAIETGSTPAEDVAPVKEAEQPSNDKETSPEVLESQADAKEIVAAPKPDAKEELSAAEPEPVILPTATVDSEAKDEVPTVEATKTKESEPLIIPGSAAPTKEEEPAEAAAPAEEQPAEEPVHIEDEASAPEGAPASAQEAIEVDVPASELLPVVETESKPGHEDSVEVPAKAEELAKDEESIKDEGPAAVEERTEAEAPTPEPLKESATGVVAEIDAKPQAVEAPAKPETASDAEPEGVVPLAVKEEHVDNIDAATKAYELAHAHENDEVIADQPSDAEIRAADLGNVVPNTEDGTEVEAIAAVEPEAKDETADASAPSESGIESVDSIPTETGETQSVVPEEQAMPSIPGEVEAKDEVKEPEASATSEKVEETVGAEPGEATEGSNVGDVSASETIEAETLAEAVEPVAVIGKEPIDATTSFETHTAVKSEDENAEPLAASEPEEQTDAASLAVIGSSDEGADAVLEEAKKDLVEAPEDNDASAHAEELISAPAIDALVETNADIVTDGTATKEADESGSGGEPAVEAHIEDVAATGEVTEPVDIKQEGPAPPVAAVEAQEDVPTEENAAKDCPEEINIADEPNAAEATAPVDVKSAPEAIIDQAAIAEELAVSEEPVLDEPADVGGEQPLAKLIQKTSVVETRPTEAEELVVKPVQTTADVEGGQLEDREAEVHSLETKPELSGITAQEAPVDAQAEESRPLDEKIEADPAPPAEVIAAPVLEATAAPEEAGARNEHAVEPVQEEIAEQLSAEAIVEGAKVRVASTEEPLAGDERVAVEEPTTVDNADAEVKALKPVVAPEVPVEETTLAIEGTALDSQAVDEAAGVVGQPQDVGDIIEESATSRLAEMSGHQGLGPIEAIESAGVLEEEPTITQEEDAKDANIATQPQAEVEAEGLPGEQPSEGTALTEDTQGTPVEPEEPVPDVYVEMPTPSTETLSFTTEEDQQETGIPLKQRLADAVDTPVDELVKLPALSSPTPTEIKATVSEEELTTPTKNEGERVFEEDEAEEEIPAIGSQEVEVSSESLLSKQPDHVEKDEVTALAGLSVGTDVTEAPERPKSPWTPSYSVITQGSAPVHPEEPEEEKVVGVQPSEAVHESIEEPSVEAKSIPTESASSPSEIKEEQTSESILITPPVETRAPEPVDALAAPDEAESAPIGAFVKLADPKETTPVGKDEGQKPVPETEAQANDVSDEVPVADVDTEAPVDAATTTLSVNTSVAEIPERPKSPWTPSYSVTTQGPGIIEPENLVLDPEVPADFEHDISGTSEEKQQAASQGILISPSQDNDAQVSSVAEATSDIDRPKSPYPPSYSVTQMGPGMIEKETGAADEVKEDSEPHGVSNSLALQWEESEPASPASESAAGSVVSSNDPEAPSSPRSDLGIVTPGFDSRSEVSDASHEPIAPSSPRTDPDVASFEDADVKTPLVVGSEVQGAPISPLQTPFMLADKVIEKSEDDADKLDISEPLTESAVSGFDADVETDRHSTTTGSWVKDTDIERDSHSDSVVLRPDASLSGDNVSENVAQTAELSKEAATSKSSIAASVSDLQTIRDDSTQAGSLEDMPDIPTSASELTIPKLDVTAPPPAAQPVIVTNSMSTDSAYTQISDSISPSQETGTNVTTPDVETMAMPKTDAYAGSEVGSIEPLDEDTVSHVSDRPWSSDSASRTPTGTEGGGKSLGVAHTLAMRSFPSAFNVGADSSSALEQSKQAPLADNLDVDQLSPLSSRRRLESTASSLAFPGGWVTSPSQKERASLEVAAGEFSRPIVEGIPVSPDVTPAATEAPSAEKENKWRCVIM